VENRLVSKVASVEVGSYENKTTTPLDFTLLSILEQTVSKVASVEVGSYENKTTTPLDFTLLSILEQTVSKVASVEVGSYENKTTALLDFTLLLILQIFNYCLGMKVYVEKQFLQQLLRSWKSVSELTGSR